MKRIIKLANLTMHDQTEYLDAFMALGYKVDPKPLLRACAGAEDAKAAACEALRTAQAQGAEGILLGGRTDMCVYAAILAVTGGFKVYVAETERLRDADGNFAFNLRGVTPVELDLVLDEYLDDAGATVCGVDAPPAYMDNNDAEALDHFQGLIDKIPLEQAVHHRLELGRGYRARVADDGAGLEVIEDVSSRLVATIAPNASKEGNR